MKRLRNCRICGGKVDLSAHIITKRIATGKIKCRQCGWVKHLGISVKIKNGRVLDEKELLEKAAKEWNT